MPSESASSRANPFDDSSRASAAGRAEARDAPRRAAVGDPGDQRRLRPGDDEVGPVVVERRESATQANVVAVAPARPRDRLLPPARADDDDAHD